MSTLHSENISVNKYRHNIQVNAYLHVSHKYFEKDTGCYYRGNVHLGNKR